MQTFLPYPSFVQSASCLDMRRLGKQRLECLQIINGLRGVTAGWVNHPATKMWTHYDNALCIYMREVIWEWKRRGYVNNMEVPDQRKDGTTAMPPWFGGDEFHDMHKALLLRKEPEFYKQYDWTVDPALPLIYPNPPADPRAKKVNP
jgi:hypothetical protein